MMELMSPAGSKESFISALDNGADAVYLGLKIFNARKPAKNFTVVELKQAKEYAASLGKKVYLTLNIDLKSNELEEASQILSYCSQIKIDGVIVKDPALLSIINIFFRDKLEIHFSTQNAVESSFAFAFAEKNKVKRVVLARELTLDEIKEIAKNSNAEIEIFSEGSMCFSISGRCYMSSYVGGKGGNRGQCQAPCRLNWRNGEKEFPFFSMKDLSLISNLKELESVGVKTLKIEGRLKSPSWVAEITSIYRKALDAPDNEEQIEVLKENLKKYSARERNTGHLFFHDNLIGLNKEFDNYKKEVAFKSDKLSKIFNNSYKIDINTENDKIKTEITVNAQKESFLSKMPSVPKKARLINFKEIDGLLIENLKDYDVKINNLLDFEASSAFLNGFVDEVVKKFNNLINEEEKLPKLDKEIIDFLTKKSINDKRVRLIGEKPNKIIINPSQIDDFADISYSIDTVVVVLSGKVDFEKIKKIDKKVVFSLPSVLFENDAKNIQKIVMALYKDGYRDFEANSFTGVEILSGFDCYKYLGYEFGLLNDIASDFFYKNGFLSVYPSIESDLSVFKSISSFNRGKVDCLIFCKPILFYSRAHEDFFKKNSLFSDKYTEISCVPENGINLFVSGKIFSLIGEKYRKEKIKFDNLTADLRYFENPKKILKDIFDDKVDFSKTTDFNLSRKLR